MLLVADTRIGRTHLASSPSYNRLRLPRRAKANVVLRSASALAIRTGNRRRNYFLVTFSIRRLIRPIPLWHAWIRRGDILPVPQQRRLFPSQPCLRRGGVYQRTRLPCAALLQSNWLL